jgi:LmbE family N-acetylglucosaminyl deacetylase
VLSRRRLLQGAAASIGSGLVASCTPRAPGPTGPCAASPPRNGRGIQYRADAPTLVLSAHCDDAAVEAWHLLSTTRPIKLAVAFMAVPPEGTVGVDDKRGSYDAAAYIRERQAEERAALAPLGIEPIFLPGLDMPYRDGKVPSLGALATDLAQLVPEASQIVCPLGIGIRFRIGTPTYSHVDHKLARDIADSFPAIPKVYFGEVYAVSEHASDYAQLEAEVRSYAHWRVEKVTLDAAALKAKEAAFRAYRTQIEPMLSALPDLLQPSLLGTEIYCYPGG